MSRVTPLFTALIILLSSVNIQFCYGQHHGDDEFQACPIQMPDLPDQVNIFTHSQAIKNAHCQTNSIQWSNPIRASNSDNEYTEIELKGKQKSDCLYFSDFQSNIPLGASIEGIEMWIEGHVVGDAISEMKIKLTNHDGKPISASKVRTSRQLAWGKGDFGDDNKWSYGGRTDNWEVDWTSEDINSKGFGVIVQIKQKEDSTYSLVRLDQIQLKIYYTPLPKLCNDTSNIFIVQPLSIACSFLWDLPLGAYINSADPNLNTITVNIEDLSHGIHEICVTTLTMQGLSEPCCMKFVKGSCNSASLGDLVWLDHNIDGIQDADEIGMDSIPVRLYSETTNKLVRDTFTDSLGHYEFKGIFEGHYYLEIIAPNSYEPSPRFATTDDNDNDIYKVSNRFISNGFYFDGLSSNYSLDAGLNDGTIKTGIVGNYVWSDRDADGIQDRFENGQNDILVSLFTRSGLFVSSQFTRTDSLGKLGFYEFTNVNPGEYYIVFEKSVDYDFTKNDLTNNDLNSDVTHKYEIGSTDYFTVRIGNHITSIDAGVIGVASIGNYIWEDENRDGIQGMNEMGINDILVQLYDENGILVDSKRTAYDLQSDLNGYYKFTKLQPGGYYIKIKKPNTYRFSRFNAGNDDSKDSDVNNSNGFGTSFIFHLSAGEKEEDIDCGLFRTSTLGNLAWDDENNNGIQEQNEKGIADVLIKLFNSNTNELMNEALTDSLGHYEFTELMDTLYYLEFFPPEDYMVSRRFATTDDMDNDVYLNNDRFITDNIPLKKGSETTNIDGGFTNIKSLFGTIGNYIWVDKDNDGVQDGFEDGINGISVTLYKSTGELVEVQTTRNNVSFEPGYYSFENIPIGEYFIVFEPSRSYNFTDANAKNNDNKDSDVTNSQMLGSTDIFTLKRGIDKMDIDAGLILISSVGDFVWYDENNNGVQDASENGINNLVVKLFKKDYTFVDSCITHYDPKLDKNGYYLFENLKPGPYFIVVEKPEGYEFNAANIGGIDAMDSDINNSNGEGSSFVFYLSGGEHERDIDAGLYKTSSLGSLVWEDLNSNGMKDNDEEGVDEVLVEIYNSQDEKVKEAYTDEEGLYEMKGIANGDYYLKFQAPEGYDFTIAIPNHPNENSDVNHDNGYGTTEAFQIGINQKLMHIDAGLQDKLILALYFVDFKLKIHHEGVELNWKIDDANEVEYFIINRKEIGTQSYTQIGQVLLTAQMRLENSFKFIDHSVVSGSKYEYFIVSVDDDSSKLQSSIQSILIPNKNNSSLTYFPNPANEQVSIQLLNMDKATLHFKILNMLGKIVKTDSLNSEHMWINVSDLANGQYILEINGNGYNERVKMIVQH